MNIKLTNVNKKKLASLMLASSIVLTTLGGCSVGIEQSSDKSDYDVLDTNLESDNELNNGVIQELEVPGENFKLVIEYYSGEKQWRITSDKKLHMNIYTKGLPSNKEVYIDTIHMDTSIVSDRALYDGIIQDTLDDHIHNSIMIGFPISDTNSYYGINVIEGQNSEFLEGFSMGYNGYHSSSIETKRRLESDYLEEGVWANKIAGVIGLIIRDTDTNELRGVDVDTTLMVAVCNEITYLANGVPYVVEFDREGKRYTKKK